MFTVIANSMDAICSPSEDIVAIGWGDGRAAKYQERFLENPHAHIWVAKQDGE